MENFQKVFFESRKDLKPALVGEGSPSIPKSWRDFKNPGGVIMTLLIVSCFNKTSGADGDNTPAQFLTSGQRVSGVHEKT